VGKGKREKEKERKRGVKGKLLKKFSLKIPFKTFHASAKGRASLLPSARIK